jgi:hypothetical protein
MIQRRRNFSFSSNSDYMKDVQGTPEEMYAQWHWGVEPKDAIEMFIPGFTEQQNKKMRLIECGRLVEFTYRLPNHKPTLRDRLYKLSRKHSNKTHLSFDPNHQYHRLYITTGSKEVKKKLKKDLYQDNPYLDLPLSEISEFAGGHHASDDYPSLDARAIGILTSIVYACEKEGDGYSFYVHKMGEESGEQPILAVTANGDLFICGGAYTAPVQGITN